MFPIYFCNSKVSEDVFSSQGICVLDDQPTPVIHAPHQLIIRVKAAALDPVDVKVAEGYGRNKRHHLNRYNLVSLQLMRQKYIYFFIFHFWIKKKIIFH